MEMKVKRKNVFEMDEEEGRGREEGEKERRELKRKRVLPKLNLTMDSDESENESGRGRSEGGTEGGTDKEEEEQEEQEEDDYLTMPIENYQPVEEVDAITRDEALSKGIGQTIQDQSLSKSLKTSIIEKEPENKGLKIMKMMGFKVGDSLGGDKDGISSEPIAVERKVGRGGIGYDSALRDKVNKSVDEYLEKMKLTKEEFLNRINDEYSEKKINSQIEAAQKVALDLDAKDKGVDSEDIFNKEDLSSINILYRQLVYDYQLHKKIRELRKNMDHPDFDQEISNSELEEAFGGNEELQEFQLFGKSNQLFQLITYLREKYYYCIFCGFSYDDEEDLKNCPGLLEVDH